MYIVSRGHCVACGTLPRDAEFKQVGAKQSSCTNFSIKADEQGDDKKAVWLRCTCWHRLAKYAAGLEKGDAVLVAGKLRAYSYTKKTGELVEGKELVCDVVIPQGEACEEVDQSAEPAQAPECNDDNGELPF